MFEWLSHKLWAALGRRAPEIPLTAPNLRDWRILLVEDHDLTAAVIKSQLDAHLGPLHHALRHVQNGKLALAAIESDPPDLVITDLFMPEMNGDDLVRQLRARGYDLPIIGMTASPVAEMDRFIAAGATGAMSKPFCVERLADLLAGKMPLPPTG